MKHDDVIEYRNIVFHAICLNDNGRYIDLMIDGEMEFSMRW